MDDCMTAITISVITPCYNGAAFLGMALNSVLAQTRPPVEVIVVDDGSTDDSASIAEGFGAPVRVLRQPNRGESVARNRGIAEAVGTHILFLDADDLLAIEALARLSDAIQLRPDSVALMGHAKFKQDAGETFEESRPQHREFFPAIIGSNFAPPHAWLVPTALVRRAGGFEESLRWFEDWDLWWRVGLLQRSLVPVDYVGALYRQHAASQLATTKMVDRTRGHALLMERMARGLLDRPDVVAPYGQPLFWSCWTALTRAHEFGVPWPELAGLASQLGRLVQRRHPRVATGKLALAIATLGPRFTVSLSQLAARGRTRSPRSTAAQL
jgi:glycosyltransferase involved in cell wall biosynthesis